MKFTLKSIICFFKGHDVSCAITLKDQDPVTKRIIWVGEYMICKRCGENLKEVKWER